jgi:outer membrane protein TolC
MKRFSIFLLCCVFVLTSAALAASDETPAPIELSRNRAIVMALNKNANLRIEALNPAIAKKALAGSRGIYDPFFFANLNGGGSRFVGSRMSKDAFSSIGVTQTLPTGGSVTASTSIFFTRFPDDTFDDEWNTDFSLNYSQPLLRNAGKEAITINISLSGNNVEESRERYRFSAADTVLATITSYNRLYTLRQQLKNRETALAGAENLLTELQKKPQKNASAQKIGIANAEYNIAQRRSDLVDASRDVNDEEADLRFLIGLYDNATLIPSDPPSRDEPPDSVKESVNKAMTQRSDLKQLQLALQSAQLLERFSKNQSRPELFLTTDARLLGTGEFAHQAYEELGEGPLQSWSAGLLFTTPLGNRAADNNYLQSKLRTEQSRQEIEVLAWTIRNEVESDMRTLISARLQLVATQKSLEFAELRSKEYQQHALKGTATVQNMIDADYDLNSARESYLNALEVFANTVAKLWRDTGELLERQGVRINVNGAD